MSTNTLRLSILANALTDNPREAPRLARGAGFSGLLYDAYSPQLALPDLSTSGLRDFRHTLAAQDQQLVGLRLDIGAKGISASADVDRVLARIDRAMQSAAAVHCRLLCIDLGPLPEPPAPPQAKPTITQEQAGSIILPESALAATPAPSVPSAPFDATAASQVDDALIDLGKRADRYGVSVAFRSELSSFAAIHRAIMAADCPWFSLDLDPVALLRDHWNLDQVLSRFGPLVRHVLARDAVLGTDRRTRPAPVGQGTTNWPELLAALDQCDYAEWITIDPTELANRSTAAMTGLQTLRHARPHA